MTATLATEDLKSLTNKLKHWTLSEDRKWLEYKYTFKDFKTAFSKMTAIALKAEQMNHHPNWSNVYHTLEIKLQTHDAGGITMKDIELASFIDTQTLP